MGLWLVGAGFLVKQRGLLQRLGHLVRPGTGEPGAWENLREGETES